MTFTREQQKITLGALIVLIVLVNAYNFMNGGKPKTAPLMYERGAVASSPVRQGLLSRGNGVDPLDVFLERHDERYPGVARDLFRMENPVVKPKPAPIVVQSPAPPPVPVKTPEEIAAEAARADLSKFRFLGYLTDKESSLFLSKDGELFIVKNGDRVLKSYKIKEANRDFVVLQDTVTGVEMRIDMSGSATPLQTTQQPPAQTVPQATQEPTQPPERHQSKRQLEWQRLRQMQLERQQQIQRERQQ
jgi:hypothetical protein